jgi:hypothetical protein
MRQLKSLGTYFTVIHFDSIRRMIVNYDDDDGDDDDDNDNDDDHDGQDDDYDYIIIIATDSAIEYR